MGPFQVVLSIQMIVCPNVLQVANSWIEICILRFGIFLHNYSFFLSFRIEHDKFGKRPPLIPCQRSENNFIVLLLSNSYMVFIQTKYLEWKPKILIIATPDLKGNQIYTYINLRYITSIKDQQYIIYIIHSYQKHASRPLKRKATRGARLGL